MGNMLGVGDLYNEYIKPSLCIFFTVAVMDFILDPMLGPILATTPVLDGLGMRGVDAILSGLYASVGIILCKDLQIL